MSLQRPHQLEQALLTQLRVLETVLSQPTARAYRAIARHFLTFLQERFPSVTRPAQLARDPHLLAWLEALWQHRTSQGMPLTNATRGGRVLQLRTLLEMMRDSSHPSVPHLLLPSDVPKRIWPLPRPLNADDDRRLCDYWDQATGLHDTALYLMRLTGMRIGECVDLSADCLRHGGDGRFSIHVPHGKPRSERWVPVDDKARSLVERLAFLRSLPGVTDSAGLLLPRPPSRADLMQALRAQLVAAAAQAGLTGHIVPHQLRHTYATSMLRAGVSLPSLMRLLGHHNANMTLLYVEITQQDLQREYAAAQLRPRHFVPPLPLTKLNPSSQTELTPLSFDEAIQAAIALLHGKRDQLPSAELKVLARLARRLKRVRALAEKLLTSAPESK